MKLRDLLPTFYEEYDNELTLKSYRQALRQFTRLIGGPDVDVTTLTRLDLKQKYQLKLAKMDYSPATVRKRFKEIKRFFNWCVEMAILDTSPAAALKLPAMPNRLNQDRAMSDDDYHKLLIAVRSNPRNYALVTFIGESGVRAVGAASLTISNLDLQARTAYVIGKGDRQRQVWYGDTAATALQEWLEVRPDDGHDYVFSSSRRAKALDPPDISQIIRRSCRRAGIKPRGSHSLRYRLAKKLVNNGVDARTRMIILGHRSLQVHLGYMPAETDRAAQAVYAVAGNQSDPAIAKPDANNIVSFRRKSR